MQYNQLNKYYSIFDSSVYSSVLPTSIKQHTVYIKITEDAKNMQIIIDSKCRKNPEMEV